MDDERLICPECGALLWHYPDGRETCSRCEYEQPLPATKLAQCVKVDGVAQSKINKLSTHSEIQREEHAHYAIVDK